MLFLRVKKAHHTKQNQSVNPHSYVDCLPKFVIEGACKEISIE